MEIGKALQGLHTQNILVVGSGFSFHNLKAFFDPDDVESRQSNASFEAWLHDICGSSDYSEGQRYELLKNWSQAPGAGFSHP